MMSSPPCAQYVVKGGIESKSDMAPRPESRRSRRRAEPDRPMGGLFGEVA